MIYFVLPAVTFFGPSVTSIDGGNSGVINTMCNKIKIVIFPLTYSIEQDNFKSKEIST